MYVTDTAGQQQSKPGFPTYDVKIIAGRRVVIFHDKKPENQPFEDLPSFNFPCNTVTDTYCLIMLNSTCNGDNIFAFLSFQVVNT